VLFNVDEIIITQECHFFIYDRMSFGNLFGGGSIATVVLYLDTGVYAGGFKGCVYGPDGTFWGLTDTNGVTHAVTGISTVGLVPTPISMTTHTFGTTITAIAIGSEGVSIIAGTEQFNAPGPFPSSNPFPWKQIFHPLIKCSLHW